MIGTKIENYRITSVLGEGGMGVVYKAFDLKLERYVALKILSEKAITNPQFVERFKREAKNQAQLSHPNIVPVYGFANDQNLLGFVMEYVNGTTLETLIEKKGCLQLIETLEIMKQVLAGAAYAHSKGFIHRDLKPSNIIFTQDGIAKIMDFGISKSIYESKGITKSGVKIGTLLYMSPEQIKAYEPTQQSDIYGLGVIFYEMLTGKNPFDADSDFQIMEAHLKKYPPRLGSILEDIPEEVDRIVFKALAKSPDKRYKNALDFYDDIEQEIIRLKSEQRKTREYQITREIKIESRSKFKNIFFVIFGLIFSAVIIYLAYVSVSGYVSNSPDYYVDSTSNIYDSSPFKLIKSGWKKVPLDLNESLTAIQFVGEKGVIIGFGGTLLITEDKGLNWRKIETGTEVNFYSMTYLNNDSFMITGERGIIYRFILSDKSLTRLRSTVNESLFDAYFTDSQNGYICGGKGIILKTTDGGDSWSKISTGSNKLLYAVTFSSKTKGFAVGWDGEVLVTVNSGMTWERKERFSNNYLRDIFFIDESTGFIVGGEGEIYKTVNSGNTWMKINSGIPSGLYFINFINAENGYILGSKGEILYSEDAGENWRSVQSGSFIPLTNITKSPDNSLFITGYNGTVLVSR
jgi:eukaryotic-like serine/threonine-protein kinase